MIEKLEEYPFLGEEEEIMTWKDGIRKERTNELWIKERRMLERMKEYEIIIKEKKAGRRSIGKERKITDEGGGSNKFVVTFTCPLSTLPDCLLYFHPN